MTFILSLRGNSDKKGGSYLFKGTTPHGELKELPEFKPVVAFQRHDKLPEVLLWQTFEFRQHGFVLIGYNTKEGIERWVSEHRYSIEDILWIKNQEETS